MELGLAIGYSGAHLDVPVARVQRADELGYDSVWSAEGRGFGDAAKRIQKLCFAGQMAEAIATVPDEWVDLKSLGQWRASANATAPGRTAARIRLSVRSREPKAIEVMAKAARLN